MLDGRSPNRERPPRCRGRAGPYARPCGCSRPPTEWVEAHTKTSLSGVPDPCGRLGRGIRLGHSPLAANLVGSGAIRSDPIRPCRGQAPRRPSLRLPALRGRCPRLHRHADRPDRGADHRSDDSAGLRRHHPTAQHPSPRCDHLDADREMPDRPPPTLTSRRAGTSPSGAETGLGPRLARCPAKGLRLVTATSTVRPSQTSHGRPGRRAKPGRFSDAEPSVQSVPSRYKSPCQRRRGDRLATPTVTRRREAAVSQASGRSRYQSEGNSEDFGCEHLENTT